MSQSGVFFNSTPTPGTGINTLTGNSGGPVPPTANNVDIIGAHGIDIVGNPGISTLTVSIENTIILGDLATVPAFSDSITAFSGDISILGVGVGAGGNLNLPSTALDLSRGVIRIAGSPVFGEYGSGPNNFGVGLNAGITLTTGANNTALGSTSLAFETTGNNNTVVGYNAGFFLNGASDNTAIGTNALSLGTAALSNIAIGSSALAALLIGEANIAIGFLAAQNYTSTESDNIIIGNDGVLGENNTIRIGTQGSGLGQQDTCFIAGIVGTTVSNPRAVVINHLTGQLGEAASTGSAIEEIDGNTGGPVLPIAGVVNIETANATVKFDGAGNTLTLDFLSTSPLGNLILGRPDASPAITGSNNIGMGTGALGVFNHLTSGNRNIGLGATAGEFLSTGSDNVYIGHLSGNVNNASFNTFVGSNAGKLAVASDNNTAVGYLALASGIGLFNNNNTAIGSMALTNCSTALNGNQIALGFNAGSTYTNLEANNIVIGNIGTASDNNTIRIGTQGSGAGQQNTCFVAGIIGNTVSNAQVVTINSVTGQLGTTGSGPTGITAVNGGNNITVNTVGSVATVNVSGTTDHAVQVGNSTGSLTSLSLGTNGQVLLGATGANPAFITPTAGNGLTLTSNAVTLQYALASPVSIANGGTNATSMTVVDGTVIYDGTRLVTTATGSTGQVLTSNGPGVAPTYQTPSSGGLANSFLFFQATNTPNLTGITTYTLGTSVALTSIVNNGGAFFAGDGLGTPAFFTAPATGVYYFTLNVSINTNTGFGGTFYNLFITTTARTYQSTAIINLNSGTGAFYTISLSTVADMTSGDTALFSVANILSVNPFSYFIQGSSTIVTSVSGYRIA